MKITMKKSQVKSIFITFLVFMLIMAIGYAVTTTLITPVDNDVDIDGYLDLRGSCEPTSASSYDGTTSWNITNATLWSNVDGTWKANYTIENIDSGPNSTYYFNFTNHINKSAEGEFQWNIQCFEENSSALTTETNSAFAGNNTIRVLYSTPTVSTDSPADGIYDLDGHEINVVCKGTSSSGWNLTSIELMTDIDGDWRVNQTHTPALPEESEVVANFTINKYGNTSIPDGTDLIFGCRVNQWLNISDGNEEPITLDDSSANRTINIEFPPIITLGKPDDDNWSQNRVTTMNFTTYTKFGSSTQFSCRVWTNESGIWSSKTGTMTATNNSGISQDVNHLETTAIKWGVQCHEAGDSNVFNFSTNRTLNIDTINPTITINTPNNTYFDDSLEIELTTTDAHLNDVKIFHNFNGTGANYTDENPTSGETKTVNFTAIDDGVYNFSILANDDSGRELISGNYTLTIDSTKPNVTAIYNYSIVEYCDGMNLTFASNESTNYTIYLDTDTEVTDGTVGNQATFGINNSYLFTFGLTGTERDWYVNITSCDQAGNCQGSDQFTYTTPAAVCQGWSQYAIYDNLINLSILQNQSGADLVYVWNATNQNWVYYSAGLSANGKVDVGKSTGMNVIHLYENVNSTWYRNTTNSGFYHYNITAGDNFVSVPTDYNFGNFTWSVHNGSDGMETAFVPATINISDDSEANNNGSLFGPWNITFFDGFNNTIQDYMGGHVFNFSWSNATIIEPCPNRQFTATCMETVWFGSEVNITWNGTNSYRNWTI